MLKSARILNNKILHCNVAKNYMYYTTETNIQHEVKYCDFRTQEAVPANHNSQHESKFYTIPQKVQAKLFTLGGFPKAFQLQVKTFREVCVMIRNPALEIINYLQNANYSAPAVRYMIYGKLGTGKSLTLSHVIHYASDMNWLLLHVPWAPNWVRRYKDYATSLSNPDRMDLPLDSALWLQHFQCQNASLLKELDLRLSQTYEWSKREITEKGEPLVKLIEKGVNRMKFASDCVGALLKEIKLQSESGRYRVLVAIDGVNSLYGTTRLKRIDKSMVEANDVTIIRAFRKLLNNDWKNAAIVVTVDGLGITEEENRHLYTPFSVLGKTGFECLEPFIPILTENYTEKEIDNYLDYYIERMWIQNKNGHTEAGRKELKFLCGYNPYSLMKMCAPL